MMREKNILLVDDCKEVFRIVEMAFQNSFIHLSWAADLKQANDLLKKNQFDLILLDIGLPDGNGLEFCSQIQLENSTVPIFFLTANDEISQKVLGFSAGADDYITKPFEPLELKARVESRIKKIQSQLQINDLLQWSFIKIIQSSQEVKLYDQNDHKWVEIELTALEFKILTYFANRSGMAIDRDEMLNKIWGKEVHVYSRSVDTHISKLRKKLRPYSKAIESIHGVGYKFVPEQITV